MNLNLSDTSKGCIKALYPSFGQVSIDHIRSIIQVKNNIRLHAMHDFRPECRLVIITLYLRQDFQTTLMIGK